MDENNRKIIIIIAVVLVLCCCCAFIASAWQFGDVLIDILNTL